MNTFEISSKKNKNGYKNFKLILLEIHSDDCVINETGTQYNDNGITWLNDFCEKQKDTLKDTSVTVQFENNEEKIAILGHGFKGEFRDGIPILDSATSIGHFTDAYITTITDDYGNKKRVLVGVGVLDYMRYPNLIDNLIERLSSGETIYGSVEILKTGDNQAIVYKYGYKDYGRIPTEYEFSGFALLGTIVAPADHTAQLLEVASLNSNDNETEETTTMDEKTLAIITDSVKATIVEVNDKSAATEATIVDLNAKLADKDKTIEELNAKIAELEKCKEDSERCSAEQNEKLTSLTAEVEKIKAEKAISEMNSAISGFSDDERAFADAEIKAFTEAPLTSEINSIVSKIYEAIGKKAKETSKVVSEQNSKKENEVSIFGDIDEASESEDYSSIF